MSQIQLTAALTFVETMGTFDYDGVRALVDPAFVHHVRPGSLGGFGHPEGFTMDQFIAFGRLREKEFTSLTFGGPEEVVLGTDHVAFLSKSTVTHPDGQKTKADQVFFITFVPGTTTVLKVIQIADSLLWYKIDEKRGRPVPEVQLYH